MTTASVTVSPGAVVHSTARLEDGVTVQPTIDAEEEWFQMLLTTVMAYATYFASCTPGYLNNEGLPPDENGGRGAAYMRSAVEFKDLLAAWRETGTYPGLVRTPLTS